MPGGERRGDLDRKWLYWVEEECLVYNGSTDGKMKADTSRFRDSMVENTKGHPGVPVREILFGIY